MYNFLFTHSLWGLGMRKVLRKTLPRRGIKGVVNRQFDPVTKYVEL